MAILALGVVLWEAQLPAGPPNLVDNPTVDSPSSVDGIDSMGSIDRRISPVDTLEPIPQADGQQKAAVRLLSETGLPIASVVLVYPSGASVRKDLNPPGLLAAASLPPGSTVFPAGHQGSIYMGDEKAMYFAPYVQLTIHGVPPQVDRPRIRCDFVHDPEAGRFFTAQGMSQGRLLILANPPESLKEEAGIGELPLTLRLLDDLAIDITFAKRPGAQGEITWSSILRAQDAGPPITATASPGIEAVSWQVFVWTPRDASGSSLVAAGPWGNCRINRQPVYQGSPSRGRRVFTGIPLNNEVLLLASNSSGDVGWSPVFRNHGQEVALDLRPRPQLNLRLEDAEDGRGLAGMDFLLRTWFSYGNPQEGTGKQSARQEVRGTVGSEGIIHIDLMPTPLQLFSWLREGSGNQKLPDQLEVLLQVPGYAPSHETFPWHDWTVQDGGVVLMKRGGYAVKVMMAEDKGDPLRYASFSSGVHLKDQGTFTPIRTHGFPILAKEETRWGLRLWLADADSSLADNTFLVLDGDTSSHYLKRSADGSYREVQLTSYRVEFGPETKAAFHGFRLAWAFGDGNLMAYPFHQPIPQEDSRVLEFMAPEEDCFLIILPQGESMEHYSIALTPGWQSLP